MMMKKMIRMMMIMTVMIIIIIIVITTHTVLYMPIKEKRDNAAFQRARVSLKSYPFADL